MICLKVCALHLDSMQMSAAFCSSLNIGTSTVDA